jgi:hypothetical protein
MGTVSFPWVKAAGRDADHTPPSSAEVKKELSYTSTHPMGPSGPVTGFPSPLPIRLSAAFLTYEKIQDLEDLDSGCKCVQMRCHVTF